MMKFVEIYDRDALNHIVRYEDHYKQLLGCSGDEAFAQFALYKKYLLYSTGNKIRVSYAKKHGRGRYFANGAVSLQSFNKKVRGTIAQDLYYDIDMVNAHPVILEDICRRNNHGTPLLRSYIQNRDETLRHIVAAEPRMDVSAAKQLILSIIYGKPEPFKEIRVTPWLAGFKAEIDEILDTVQERWPYEYGVTKQIKGDDYFNLRGATLASVISIVENDILMELVRYAQEEGYIIKNACVLVFDGIMLPKNAFKKRAELTKLIAKMKTQIFETMGISMDLKVKEFDTLPMEIPYGVDPTAVVRPSADDVKNLYRSSNYYWGNLIKDMTGKVYESFNELADAFTTKSYNNLMRVHEFNDFIIRKITDDNKYQLDKKIPNHVFSYGSFDTKGNPVVADISLSKLLDTTVINSVSMYDKLTFRPIGHLDDYAESPNVFNTWTGFKSKYRRYNDHTPELEMILNHIRRVWCSDNEEYYNYIISWFKVIFTKPTLKTKVAIVLKSSDKQIGKGIIINNFLIPLVFGSEYSLSVAGLDTITARFNQILMNKLFINCDELSTLEGSYHTSFDVLKKRITDCDIKIEIKGGKSFIYPDYSNYLFCTNHDFTIKIEQDDARYFILDCAPVFKGDFAYFGQLAECFTQDVADEFYSYVIDFNDAIEIRNIPMTQLKREMMISGFQSPIRYLLDVKNEDWVINRHFQGDDDDEDEDGDSIRWYSHLELYRDYLRWCNASNEKHMTKMKFSREIKGYLMEIRQHRGRLYRPNFDALSF